MRRTGLVEGVSKADLLADGIEYVPAPLDAQMFLASAVGSYVCKVIKLLQSGEGHWEGDCFATTHVGTVEDYMKCIISRTDPATGGRLTAVRIG